MVSIAAFQAVDPGSIPGRRICLHFFPPHTVGLGSELEALSMASSLGWVFSLLVPIWGRWAPVVLMDGRPPRFLPQTLTVSG